MFLNDTIYAEYFFIGSYDRSHGVVGRCARCVVSHAGLSENTFPVDCIVLPSNFNCPTPPKAGSRRNGMSLVLVTTCNNQRYSWILFGAKILICIKQWVFHLVVTIEIECWKMCVRNFFTIIVLWKIIPNEISGFFKNLRKVTFS